MISFLLNLVSSAQRLPADAKIEAFSDGDPHHFFSRGLFDRPRVAGQSGAAHVAHFGAVEAAGTGHRRAGVPDDEGVGPPIVRIGESGRRGMVLQPPPDTAPSPGP